MLIRIVLCFLVDFFRSRHALATENALLRYQLGIMRRQVGRPIFRRWDRPIMLWLSQRLANWRRLTYIVQPETIINWQKKGFRLFWYWKATSRRGRRKIPLETIKLIQQIALANPRWGAPRIHGELLKLGIELAQSTVENYVRIVRGRGPKSGQRWATFLRNHMKDVIAIDFFIVPTLEFKMLWVLVILSHDRRKILSLTVTEKPSPTWTAQQIRNSYPFEEIPKTILHDRDRNFWGLSQFGIQEFITAHRCPWQNAFVERVIGTIRRECTDHLLILSKNHLEKRLDQYKVYYNRSRTHLGLKKDTPFSRPIERRGQIFQIKHLSGLHTEFRRAA